MSIDGNGDFAGAERIVPIIATAIRLRWPHAEKPPFCRIPSSFSLTPPKASTIVIGAKIRVFQHNPPFAVIPEPRRSKAGWRGLASFHASRGLRDGGVGGVRRARPSCPVSARTLLATQEARLLELRAATDLGWLWRDTGSSNDPRALLETTLAAIEGGETTRDVRNGRALLAALD
jgi:hypothetical protein